MAAAGAHTVSARDARYGPSGVFPADLFLRPSESPAMRSTRSRPRYCTAVLDKLAKSKVFDGVRIDSIVLVDQDAAGDIINLFTQTSIMSTLLSNKVDFALGANEFKMSIYPSGKPPDADEDPRYTKWQEFVAGMHLWMHIYGVVPFRVLYDLKHGFAYPVAPSITDGTIAIMTLVTGELRYVYIPAPGMPGASGCVPGPAPVFGSDGRAERGTAALRNEYMKLMYLDACYMDATWKATQDRVIITRMSGGGDGVYSTASQRETRDRSLAAAGLSDALIPSSVIDEMQFDSAQRSEHRTQHAVHDLVDAARRAEPHVAVDPVDAAANPAKRKPLAGYRWPDDLRTVVLPQGMKPDAVMYAKPPVNIERERLDFIMMCATELGIPASVLGLPSNSKYVQDAQMHMQTARGKLQRYVDAIALVMYGVYKVVVKTPLALAAGVCTDITGTCGSLLSVWPHSRELFNDITLNGTRSLADVEDKDYTDTWPHLSRYGADVVSLDEPATWRVATERYVVTSDGKGLIRVGASTRRKSASTRSKGSGAAADAGDTGDVGDADPSVRANAVLLSRELTTRDKTHDVVKSTFDAVPEECTFTFPKVTYGLVEDILTPKKVSDAARENGGGDDDEDDDDGDSAPAAKRAKRMSASDAKDAADAQKARSAVRPRVKTQRMANAKATAAARSRAGKGAKAT